MTNRCSYESPSPRVQCTLPAGHDGEHSAPIVNVYEACAQQIAVIPTRFGELRVSILSNQCVVVSEVYKETVGPIDREDPGSKLVLSADDLRLLLRALLTAAPRVGVICLDPNYMDEVTLSVDGDGTTRITGKG